MGRQVELENVNMLVDNQTKDQPYSGDAILKNDTENVLTDIEEHVSKYVKVLAIINFKQEVP